MTGDGRCDTFLRAERSLLELTDGIVVQRLDIERGQIEAHIIVVKCFH